MNMRGFTEEEAKLHREGLKKLFNKATGRKLLFTGYRPHFYFKTTNKDGAINLPLSQGSK